MSKPTPAVYTIMVWWMHGWPIGRIASWSGKTTGTIRGITTRAYSSPSRAEMTQAERQAELNRLKLDRLDGGRLKDEWFIAIPIHGKRVASIDGGNIEDSESKPSPPINGREQAFPRKPKLLQTVVRENRKAAKLRAAREAKEAREREKGSAPRGTEAAAFEWLNQRGVLADPPTKIGRGSDGSAIRRLTCGLQLRSWIDQARIGGMASVNFESSGGSSTPGQALVVRKLQAIDKVGRVRQGIASIDKTGFDLLEMIIDRDEFVFHQTPQNLRAHMYERIRRALDVIAVIDGMMERRAFVDRWSLWPNVGEAMDARTVASAARELFRVKI